MPKTKISEFSSTPANNTDIDSINIAEGCAPSGINDAIRELMAQLKDFQVGSAGDPVTVGGVLTVQAGSASTPALTTAGDTNTGMFFPAADTIAFAEGGAEAMRLDASGNMGLGVTPSAWWSDSKAMQVGAGTVVQGRTGSASFAEIGANVYLDSSATAKYIATSTASRYQQAGGVHYWYNAPSGTAGNAITFTQAMTLDASGRLIVGGTSPATDAQLTISAELEPTLFFQRSQGGNNDAAIQVSSGGSILFKNGADSSTAAGLTERARIDSSGNLLVGKTSTADNVAGTRITQGGLIVAGRVNADPIATIRFDTNGDIVTFYRGTSNVSATQVGSVSVTTTATAYNTSSDYRLKNITGNLTGYKERLMSLQPKQGTWKVDGSEFRGFLAHEFSNPYSASVTGEKDAVDENGNPMMQSMQASSSEVMADLVALIQEQQVIIESLKARLDAANL
jgi:hypothetical protein